MGLKLATIEDLEVVLKLCYSFADEAPHKDMVDKIKIKEVVETFLNADNSEKIILLYDDVGMLVADKVEFIFGRSKLATEIAWYVDPEHRQSQIGNKLIEAFEYWGKSLGCTACILSTIEAMKVTPMLHVFYEKRGYKIYERAYFKEI